MAKQSSLDTTLKDACQITGSVWAACVERNQTGWLFRGKYRLTKKRRRWLEKYIADEKIDRWLCGAITGGNARSRKLASFPDAGVPNLYSFPVSNSEEIFVVGSDILDNKDKKVWKILAAASTHASENDKLAPPDAFVFSGQTTAPYDLPRSLDRILSRVLYYVPAKGAFLARYGERSFKIDAQYKAAKFLGKEIDLNDSKLLAKIVENRELARVSYTDSTLGKLKDIFPATTVSLVALPLTIGHRLTGLLVLWRSKEFSDEEWLSLQHLVAYVASSVDIFITFSEMADHLKRQAMLNDFALVISSAQNLSQIVRRVFELLSRTFGTKYISLFLLSSDGRTLREYRYLERRSLPRTEFFDGHPVASFINQGRNLRLEDASSSGYPFSDQKTKAALIIPLKYRGVVIGLLSLESKDIAAFGGYDENLLVVIASHLSGLVEYGRLRDEAEARARNLGLIHEIIQQVIGLTDIQEVAQITADTLVQYFAYDLAAVLLVDRNNELKINGISGEAAPLIKKALSEYEDPHQGGITGYVFQTGESIMVDDAPKHPQYLSVPGWNAGSEICVALQDGDRIWGVIDVESSDSNAFNHNDLLALESLAGFLTSAVSSVDRYQMLQDTIQILQTTQDELNERMEAQRNAENRLVQAAKLAAVGEMAAGVAHELNNPLTTVAGFSELVLDDLDEDSPQREDLKLVLREATRARNVVRRLLDFARQSDSVRVRADINEVVEDVSVLMRHLFETNHIEFSMELMSDLPWVLMDRDQIKQVVLNLLHNALHAMPNGGNLLVATKNGQKNNRNWAIMSVKDSGSGISPHDLARVFEPFFTTKADNGGTGLGLAVSYGIITDHNGFIDVDSAPEKGACFNVWLPLEEDTL